jgi:hypothetical protein
MKRLFSKLFSGGKRACNDEVEKLIRFFDDESVQNGWAPKAVREKITGGTSVDEIASSFGEFGRTLTNPIPVNGAVGEVVYLSSLRHLGKTKILFHRLGSLHGIDVYETVDIDGSEWSILYFDMYHPRKSRKSPKGYSIASRDQSSYGLYGVNHLVPNFPHGLFKAVNDFSDRFLRPSMVPLDLRKIEETVRFVRPKGHIRLRDDLEVEWVCRPGTYAEVARRRRIVPRLQNGDRAVLDGQTDAQRQAAGRLRASDIEDCIHGVHRGGLVLFRAQRIRGARRRHVDGSAKKGPEGGHHRA